jgi:hypothetical protein
MRAERGQPGESGQYFIRDVEGDMGEDIKMDIIIQWDGDAIVAIRDPKERIIAQMEFCTVQGGTHHPGLAMKFREIAELLYKQAHPTQNPEK